MIFIINNALVATEKKVAPTTSAGDFARILSAFILILSANKPAFKCHDDRTQLGGCGRLHAVPG